MRCWKITLAFLVSVWLPVQGYAAVAMPFCQHAMAGHRAANPPHPSSDTADVHAHHAGPAHHGDHAHAAATDNPGAGHHSAPGDEANDEVGKLGCNNCGACSLACSPAIVEPAGVQFSSGRAAFAPTLLPPSHTFYPEQDHRPPLSALA
jgi:ferredoxin